MKRLFIVLSVLVVLSACSNEVNYFDYKFFGVGEHWGAEFYFSGKEIWEDKNGTVHYYNEIDDEFVLTYKGSLKELSSIKFLEYSYEMRAGSGGSTRKFDEPPREFSFKIRGGTVNGVRMREDDVIQVNVKWDDYEESFELNYTSK